MMREGPRKQSGDATIELWRIELIYILTYHSRHIQVDHQPKICSFSGPTTGGIPKNLVFMDACDAWSPFEP